MIKSRKVDRIKKKYMKEMKIKKNYEKWQES